jgi:hypothetical protein
MTSKLHIPGVSVKGDEHITAVEFTYDATTTTTTPVATLSTISENLQRSASVGCKLAPRKVTLVPPTTGPPAGEMPYNSTVK